MRLVFATKDLAVAGRSFEGFPLLVGADGWPVEPAQSFLWHTLVESGEALSALTWEAYGRRLRELMVEASGRLSGAEDMRVYLRPGDMHYAADLSDAVPEVHLSFLEGEFQLGGLIVESPSLGLRCDSSFDSALEALEGHFAELFGLSLADEPEGGDQA